MKERILEFLKTENKSSAQFAEEINVQPSSISHIISGRNNPSLDFVMKMLLKYPTLSTDWLLFGRGNMYKDSNLNDLFNSNQIDTDDEDQNVFEKTNNGGDISLNISEADNNTGINKSTSDRHVKKIKRIVWFFYDDTFREYFQDKG